MHNFDMINTGSTCKCSCTNRIKSTWTMLLVDIPYLGSIWLAYETRPVSAYAGWNEASERQSFHWGKRGIASKFIDSIDPNLFGNQSRKSIHLHGKPILFLYRSLCFLGIGALTGATWIGSIDSFDGTKQYRSTKYGCDKLSHTGCFMKIQILLHCGFERYPVATFHKLPGRWGCCGCFVRDSLLSAAKSGC